MNVILGMGMPFMKQTDGRTDLSWRAVTALIRVMLDKSFLHGMKVIPVSQPFDGSDVGSLAQPGEGKTRIHATTVDQHGTGAALTPVTPLFSPRQGQIFPQGIQQGDPGIDI